MNISGNRVGTVVNFFMENGLQSKDFHDNDTADKAFKALLKAKADPTEENILEVYAFLNQNIRIARSGGFEFDPNSGNIFMKGFYSTPVPEKLMETVEEYVECDYPIESITNFWKLLMANPDKRVRESLFKFIETHNFVLTDQGYMIVYKTVDYKNDTTDSSMDIASFVSNSYLKVRKHWGTSTKKYVVFKEFMEVDLDGDVKFELKLTKKVTFDRWDVEAKNVELVGRLDKLQANLDELIDEDSVVFTDLHTHTMEIRLGEPVKMDRTECDSDPAIDCSYGLHVGATSYVENFARSESVVLMCLVNPMNVVAVPTYDHSKMRVTEYYPFALGSFENRKIDIIEQPFFDYDYVSHEAEELERILEIDMEEARTISLNAPDDDRTDEEYKSILESRVVDLMEGN